MGKNIFESAKFGDKFLCRNGEIAIYQDSYDMSLMFGSDKSNIQHRLFTKDYILDTNDTGILGLDDESIQELIDFEDEITPKDRGEYDIISRYQEPIDEDKLDEISAKECIMMLDKYNKDIDSSDVIELMILAYRHAYRKAKEE